MPALLSEGNKHYNRARKIHPNDPIAKLDYYIPSAQSSAATLTSSSDSVSDKSNQLSNHNESDTCKWSVPSAFNSSGDNNSLEKFVRRRRSRNSKISKDPNKIVSISPEMESSGVFSDSGAQNEKIFHEMFIKPIQNNNHLSNSNAISRKQSLLNDSWSRVKSINGGQQQARIDSISHFSDNRPTVFQQSQYKSRLKRRNIHKHNRRMIFGYQDHLINPYALSELFSQSEIPGFREIFASDSYLRKFCWIVAFIIMTIFSLKDMTELLTEYFEFPITVKVRHIDSPRLPFPAVTVCNLNVVRFSALCLSGSSKNFENLAEQIPVELREKLCGMQVEKPNQNSNDSDLSDINNIRLTTSTTISATTAAPTTTITNPTSINDTPTQMDPIKTTSSSATTMSLDHSTSLVPNGGTIANHIPSTSSPTIDFDDKRAPITLSSTAQTSYSTTVSSSAFTTTTRRQRITANGALDLGPDFVDSALLLDNKRRMTRRSIGSNEKDFKVKPFASRSRILLPVQNQISSTGTHSQTQQVHDRANQFNGIKLPASIASNSNNRLNSPNKNQNAITNINSYQNPMLGNNPHTTPNSKNIFEPTISATTPSHTFITSTPSTNILQPEGDQLDQLTERQERELQESLTNWLAVMNNIDQKLTWSLGHQFDDMIMRCTMKSINCTHQRSFENSFTPTEGNCFTYRSKMIKRKSTASSSTQASQKNKATVFYEETNLAGTTQGLELVLNLEKSEYISGSSQVGALVMIHHPNDLGYAASEATFVAPEFTTYIGLKMVNITRLPSPYPENCIDNWPPKFADTLTRNSTYSQQACLKICLQKTIQSHCQCQSAQLPIVGLDQVQSSGETNVHSNHQHDNGLIALRYNSSSPASDRIIICDTRKLAIKNCVREVMFRAADRVHNCECPQKCQVVRYDKTVSMARWPTKEDKVNFDRGKMDVNFQNLAKVIVYFQTMTCEEVSQQAVFNAAKLFSALGGIMGMYVGFSFLSVFEIFEVMSRKMWHHFKVKLSNSTAKRRFTVN